MRAYFKGAPRRRPEMMKVLVADAISEEGLQLLRDAGFDVVVKTGQPEAEVAKLVGDCDALLVRSATKVTRKVLEAGKKLKVVGRAGVGVDNIDLEAATSLGIVVMNTPHGNTISAAEHTVALLLSLARNIPQAHASTEKGEWERKKFQGVEVNGKVLGILGLGRIGREVAKRARGLAMRVTAFDPYLSKEAAAELGVDLASFDDVLKHADFITIHTPLTDATKKLIGEAELSRMKPGVRLLNVARGGIVDEMALAQALKSGRVAAAALDVFETEPPKGSPLLGLPNIVVTPHLGASTVEAQEKVAVQVADQVARYLTRGEIVDAVNMPKSPDPHVAPFLSLAEAMGSFAVQLGDGHPSEVHVLARGELAKWDTEPVTLAALKGLLAPSVERVTLVNAALLAKERGIRVTSAKSEAVENYVNSVAVTLRAGNSGGTPGSPLARPQGGLAGEVGLVGTLLPKLGPRIVEVNGFEVEFKPHGRFLLIPHTDTPGTVGRIGTLLGKNNVNIAQMVVGRRQARGDAVSILRVDDPIPPEVLERIRTGEGFERARVVVV